ncbi:MAG TPA: response regulator [Candidatus Angelobacter sp.]|nr:response regulator [Candidatus Angelobacter sp.]
MRALVVEDSSTIRMILCHYLRKMNIEVVEAVDGRDALERLKGMSPPDVVLVDWNMPVMSGIDFIRAVRELRVYDPLPLIMVTTNSEAEHLSLAMEAGANEFIQKPCTLDALREKLDLLGLFTK